MTASVTCDRRQRRPSVVQVRHPAYAGGVAPGALNVEGHPAHASSRWQAAPGAVSR